MNKIWVKSYEEYNDCVRGSVYSIVDALEDFAVAANKIDWLRTADLEDKKMREKPMRKLLNLMFDAKNIIDRVILNQDDQYPETVQRTVLEFVRLIEEAAEPRYGITRKQVKLLDKAEKTLFQRFSAKGVIEIDLGEEA